MNFGKKQIIIIVVALFIMTGLAIGLPFIVQGISSMDRTNIILTALTASFTALLVIGAIAAAVIALNNLIEIRKQNRHNAFLAILKELSEPESRMNRTLIFILNEMKSKDPNNYKQMQEAIENNNTIPRKYDTSSEKPPKHAEYKYAIEATVSCLDRVGFFLLKCYPELQNEAPKFIREITSKMWARTEWYVSHRRQSSKEYCQYFEKLNKEAEKHGYIENLAELKDSKEVA
jgi:hypothetical protein